MVCSKCKNIAVIKLQDNDRSYCKKCFSELIEKRVRKHIRINHLLDNKEVLLVKDDVSMFFLQKIIKNPNIKIVKRRTKQVTKEVLPFTLDDELNLYLDCVFKGCKSKIPSKKTIKLFTSVLETELGFFCKLHKLNWEPMKKESFYKDIEKISKKHPSIKFNLLKGFEQLK